MCNASAIVFQTGIHRDVGAQSLILSSKDSATPMGHVLHLAPVGVKSMEENVCSLMAGLHCSFLSAGKLDLIGPSVRRGGKSGPRPAHCRDGDMAKVEARWTEKWSPQNFAPAASEADSIQP